MKKIQILIVIGCLLSLDLNAQEERKWMLNISGTGLLQSGNSIRLLLHNNASFDYIFSEGTKFTSKNYYVYGTLANNFLKENDYRSYDYLTLNNKKKWNYIVGFYFETTRRKRIKSLVKPMVGLQYRLIDNDKIKLYPSILGSYAWENYNGTIFQDFDNEGKSSINSPNANFSIDAHFNILKDHLLLDLFTIYQLGLSDKSNNRFWFEASMKVPVTKGFHFTLSVANYYESIVLQGLSNNDLDVTYGFGYTFR